MAKTFYVRTHATVYYDNLIRVDEEEMKRYKDERPDLTEKEIIAEMYADGNYKLIDATIADVYDEVVAKCKEGE